MRGAFGLVPKEFVSDTELYDFKDSVAAALSKVEKLGAIVVTKNGEYYGMVDDRSVAGKGATNISKGLAVGKLAKPVSILTSDSDINDAISMFYSSALKALPFSENGKIKGIVKRSEVLKAILSMHILSSTSVNDIMSTPVIAITQESSLERAISAMRDNKVNRLAVLRKGKFYGIISAKDIMEYGMKHRARNPEFSVASDRPHTHVSDVCQSDPYTIDYGAGVESAIRHFVENNISSLPVIRKGRPVGIVTVSDVFETVLKNANVKKRNIVVSGLDDYTREREGEILDALENLADKVDRFRSNNVDYMAVNVKRIKQREYEIRGRLSLTRSGAISAYASGYSLELTLRDLIARLYKGAKSKNDFIIAGRTR